MIAQRLLLKLFGLRAALLCRCAAFRKAQGTVLQTDQSELLISVCLLAGLGCLISLTSTQEKALDFITSRLFLGTFLKVASN